MSLTFGSKLFMLVGGFTWDSYDSYEYYLLTGELFLVEDRTFAVERVVETEERHFSFSSYSRVCCMRVRVRNKL